MILKQPNATAHPRHSFKIAHLLRWGLLILLSATVQAATATGHPTAPSSAAGLFHWRPFLAPFHSVILHFPIGFVTLAFLLELYYWWRPSRDVARVVSLVLGLSVVAAAAAAALGLLRASNADYDAHTLTMHQWTGLSVVGLMAITLGLHLWAGWEPTRFVPVAAYRITLTIGVGLMIYAGHFGGNLTHGSKYLVQNAPAFVRSLMDPESATDAGIAPDGDPQDQFFREKIQPVFTKKCAECHGAEKQKGGYRLDIPMRAYQGGKSGERAIVPGDPLHSHLVQVITLLPQDDAIMPPEGKAVLTAQEIVDIIHWIADGARFPAATGPAAVAPTNPPAGTPNGAAGR